MTFHAQCHTDIFPPLTISESTVVDNPPGSKLPKLSLTRLQNISINPIELNRLPPQPSISLLTLEDKVNQSGATTIVLILIVLG